MRKNFSAAVKRQTELYARGHCMICGKATNKPRIAHIIPASKEGPRSEYINDFSEEFIISSKNALSLCNDCHDKIDDEGLNSYSLQELLAFNERSRKNFELLEEYREQIGLTNISYTEEIEKFYEILLKELEVTDEELEDKISKNMDFIKIDVDEKLKKNLFNMLQKRRVLNCYAYEFYIFKEAIESNVIISAKLTAAIKVLYKRLLEMNNNQSEIFDEMKKLMIDPSQGVLGNDLVLSYYFIICEVFKK
ncbi:hypothetical protein UT300003_29360 [Clostridium sardiniense]